jgi:hypothetical protein
MGKDSSAGTTYDYYGTIACGLSVYQTDDVIGWILNGSAVWPQGNAWPPGGATFNVTTGQLYVFDAQTWVAQQNFTVPANPANTDPTIPGNNAAYWIEYTFPRPGSFVGGEYNDFTLTDPSNDTTFGNLRFYWGLSTQTVDPVLNGDNDAGDVHPSYAGVSFCIPGPGTTPGGNSNGFLLGQEVQAAPSIEGILRRATTQTVVTGTPATIVDGQVNLAAAMAEILTGVNGIGLPSAMLDATSFNAVATYLQSNEPLYGGSPLIDTSDTLRSVCDTFTQMIDGFIRYNPSTALIELGVYEHGVTPTLNTASAGDPPNGVLTLTEDSLTERPQLKTTSWQGTYSRATVRYNDRQLNFQQTSLHADDPRAWAVLKTVREISLDRPWITRAEQALLHGRETLRVVGHAQMTGTLSVRREIGRYIRGGDYVLLDVDIEPNNTTIYQFFRVTKRTIPSTGPIKLEVLADNTLAAIPASNLGAPIVGQANPVPAVTYARLCEVPTVLSGQRGAVACLVQRPGTLVTGCGVYFDTNASTGTFPQLGSFSGFAARGMLDANITAAAGTITVDVDTTQPDADFFTQQFSANEQADDAMLAFIVQYGTVSGDPGTSDGGQISEAGNGYALMEICSVSTITLVSAGKYTLTVLRGRQNTIAQAFTSADSEVWLIPRSNLTTFTSAIFPTLRANRAAGTTPAYGLFRFAPFTFVGQYALSSAADWSFRFALNSPSVPMLTLTAPASLAAQNYTSQPYPIPIPVVGEWSDPNGMIVEVSVALVIGGVTRTILDQVGAPAAQKFFNCTAQIDAAGSYELVITARDSINFTSTVVIPITATGSGATCAAVNILDAGGNVLQPGNNPNYSYLPQLEYILYGALKLACTTPGAIIYFQTSGPINNQGAFEFTNVQQAYSQGQLEPWFVPFSSAQGGEIMQANLSVKVWATAPGYANSPVINYFLPFIMSP